MCRKLEKLISIIITYINEIDYLREAIQSALDQSLDEMEILVVCNDRMVTSEADIPIPSHTKLIWLHEPIRGSAFARNMGLQHASGEWVQFLDVDDLLMKEKISHQLPEENIGAVISPHIYRRLNGTEEPSKWIARDVWEGLLNSGLGSTSSMLWNKEALLKAGGWSTKYQSHQEYELLFRLLKTGHSIVTVDEFETIVRERQSGSITLATKNTRAKEGIKLREEIWSYLKEQKLDTAERHNAFLQYIFRQLRSLFRSDRELAKQIYKKYFQSQKFDPVITGIPFYNILFKLLGFEKTETIFRQYSVMRDKFLPFLPKNN
jgi:glycosyltransferase involved in cell wall biosynthesis